VNKKVIRIVGIIIMAVAVIFLVNRFLSFDVDFAELFTSQTLPGLLIVTVCVMVTLFIGSVGWDIWLSFFSGQRVPVLPTYSIYTRSNIAKYFPGNVGHYAMRQLYGTSLGIKQRELLFSTVLEIFCMALTALVLSIVLARDVFFLFVVDVFQKSWVLPAIIILIAVVVAAAVFFMRKKNISASEIFDYLKQKSFRLSLISVIGLMACNMMIFGLSLLLLFRFIANVDGTYGLLIISAGIVSWLIGFITPGVPGGIGVREAVMVLMLTPMIDNDVVLFIAVIQRVAYIFSDVISWVIGKALERQVGTL